MILRIGFEVGIPHYLFAEHHLTVNHGRALAVATAQVESDAASVEVPAQGQARLFLVGLPRIRRMLHNQRLAVHPIAHEFEVEGPLARWGIHRTNMIGDANLACDSHLAPAALPQQKLHQSLDIALVQGDVFAFVRAYRGVEDRHRTIRPLQHHCQLLRRIARHCDRAVLTVPQRSRHEVGIQRGNPLGSQLNQFRHNNSAPARLPGEAERLPLLSIPLVGQGFSRHRGYRSDGAKGRKLEENSVTASSRVSQVIPRHGCVPAEPASVSPSRIIVTLKAMLAVDAHLPPDRLGRGRLRNRWRERSRFLATLRRTPVARGAISSRRPGGLPVASVACCPALQAQRAAVATGWNRLRSAIPCRRRRLMR